MNISPWMLIPYQVRVAFWLAILGLVIWLAYELNGTLEAHYTAQQNVLVAQDAARTNAVSLKLSQAHAADLEDRLKKRDERMRVLAAKEKEQDDELDRLKQQKPEVRAWAESDVPADIAARHNRVR